MAFLQVPPSHPTPQLLRTRLTDPSLHAYLCGVLGRVAEEGLQDRVRGGAHPLFVVHAQQGGQRPCYLPEKTNTYLSIKTTRRSTITITAARRSPLKYLPEEQEADGDGDGNPQIRQLGVDFAIAAGQVGPAVAFREPDPVCPHGLAEVRQHSKTELTGTRKRNEASIDDGRKENMLSWSIMAATGVRERGGEQIDWL